MVVDSSHNSDLQDIPAFLNRHPVMRPASQPDSCSPSHTTTVPLNNPSVLESVDQTGVLRATDASTVSPGPALGPNPNQGAAAKSSRPWLEPLRIAPQQRRWAWTEIDREAISQNLKSLRKVIGPDTLVLAVVKADGYGHGAVEVARVAVRSGARYLGVASVSEGVELRRAGIEVPILILAEPPLEAVSTVLQFDLTPTVYTREFALALGEAADAQGLAAPFHLKIDSGMNRIGVHFSDAGDFLRSLSFHRALRLEGCFTHFATADGTDTFSLKTQQERFEQALHTIRYMGIDPGIVHAANSAAAIRYKQLRYDMVRLGISIYGLHPSSLTKSLINLRPAMSVRARVNAIKPVPLGEGVGYGFHYRSPGSVLIATIPIGYGDGLSRALSEKIDILVNGYAYPQVGTICMDMCMFEVSQRQDISSLRRAQISANRPNVEFGSEAVIVGKSGDLEVGLDDLAQKIGTISYDLACMFGLRLERVYRD